MRYIGGIISYYLLEYKSMRLSRYTLKKSLKKEVGSEETALNFYFRKQSHLVLKKHINSMNLNDDVKNYVLSVILKHEKNFDEAYRNIKNIEDSNLLPLKIELIYKLKDIEAIKELVRRRIDVLFYLDTEDKISLIKYLKSKKEMELSEELLYLTHEDKFLVEQTLYSNYSKQPKEYTRSNLTQYFSKFYAKEYTTADNDEVMNLIKDEKLTQSDIYTIRQLIREDYIDIYSDSFIEAITKNQKLIEIFYHLNFIVKTHESSYYDRFIGLYLTKSQQEKIYNEALNQLNFFKESYELNLNFKNYCIQKYVTNYEAAEALFKWLILKEKYKEYEVYINKLKIKRQYKINKAILIYLNDIEQFTKAKHFIDSNAKLNMKDYKIHRALINFYNHTGNIKKRYEHIIILNEKKRSRLLPKELLHAKQEYALYKKEWDIEKAYSKNFKSNDKRILFILNKSYPILNGYTIRSHEIIKRVSDSGYQVNVVTRLGWSVEQEGYNKDQLKPLNYNLEHIDLSSQFSPTRTPIKDYFDKYTDELYKIINDVKPSVVHAASNFQNALPALKLADVLDIPSIYEVRGLWHHTQASKKEEFYNSERFNFQEEYEIVCCNTADEVLCISDSLKAYLVERGINKEKITVIPNGVDTVSFQSRKENSEIINKFHLKNSYVLGFVGSITNYEGLDLVVRAVEKINRLELYKKPIKLLIVGEGQYKEKLARLVEELSIEEYVIFTGKVSREQVPEFYSVIDITPFARKNLLVCQLVPPLKIYEAMMLEKKVVSSDVRALKDMVIPGYNAEIFEADNLDSFIASIIKIIDNENIGGNAKLWVKENRDWNLLVQPIIELYNKLISYKNI